MLAYFEISTLSNDKKLVGFDTKNGDFRTIVTIK